MRALERLVERPRSAPELAEALQLDVRSARRLLQRLKTEGYAVQDGGHRRRYRPTLRLAALGGLAMTGNDLPRLARPLLIELSSRLEVDAHLWVSGGAQVVCIAHAGGQAHERPTTAEAPSTVLSAQRRLMVSSVYVSGASSTCAAAILDRGAVVAALGLTGRLGIEALGELNRAAAQLTAVLEER